MTAINHTITSLPKNANLNMDIWANAVSLAKEQVRHGKIHFSELNETIGIIYKQLVKLDAMTNEVNTPAPAPVNNVITPAPECIVNNHPPKAEKTTVEEPTIKITLPRQSYCSPNSPKNKKIFMGKCYDFLKQYITLSVVIGIEQRGTHIHGMTNRFRVFVTVNGQRLNITRTVAIACGLRYSAYSDELYIHGYGPNFLHILTSTLSVVIFDHPMKLRHNVY